MSDTITAGETAKATFTQLFPELHPDLLKAIEMCGYHYPTPIQATAMPHVLAGKDLIGCAQTGTGKTATFIVPAIHRLSQKPMGRLPRLLVLTPTRELATQIEKAAIRYGRFARLRVASLVGGMPYPQQIRQLKEGVDIIIATPGRLIDHMESQRVNLSQLEMLVLDEADRMADMGFIDDVKQIAKATPSHRQTLLFSATVDARLQKEIGYLLKAPIIIDLSTKAITPKDIEQHFYLADNSEHKLQLFDALLNNQSIFKAIVFCATKSATDDLAYALRDAGYAAAALHGDLRQNVRNRVMEELRRGRIQFLVATDVAARGLNVRDISHVFNYDLPRSPEDYVHRIGRTGRGGKSGIALSLVSANEGKQIQLIEKYLKLPCRFSVVEGLEPQKRLTNEKAAKNKGRYGKSRSSRAPAGRNEKSSRPYSHKKPREGFSKEQHSTSRAGYHKRKSSGAPTQSRHH